MKNVTAIELPTPPQRRHHGKRESNEFCSWLEAAGHQIVAESPNTIHGNVAIRILASLPPEPSELGQIANPIVDLLETYEVIARNAVSDLALRWDRTVPEGRVRVEFRNIRPPHIRVGANARARIAIAQRKRWDRVRAAKAAAAEERHSDV